MGQREGWSLFQRVSQTALIIGLGVVLAACESDSMATINQALGYEPRNKLVLVFIDVSASMRSDFAVQRESWKKIKAALRGGDRIVLAPITDKTFTQFRPALDEEIPAFNLLTDNKLRYERQLTKVRKALDDRFEKLLKSDAAPKTNILHVFTIAEKIFQGETKRHRVLVLISDMLEDSARYNFQRTKLTPDFTNKLIKQQQEKGELPNLAGAVVYVAGASAVTPEKVFEVQRFWLTYASAISASLKSENYAPTLLRFE